uniref:Uncharacterized protein n=1 Tax=Arundo donax TaxID=35708 RepID=A0A0A9AIE6_ARUDO
MERLCRRIKTQT